MAFVDLLDAYFIWISEFLHLKLFFVIKKFKDLKKII